MRLFFKSFQVLYGYDLGYFNHTSRKTKRFEKLYYILKVLITVFVPIPFLLREEFDISLQPWVALHSTHSYIYVALFILLPTNSKFAWFESEMEDVDRLLKCDKTSKSVKNKLMLTVIFIYVFIFFLMAHMCVYLLQCEDYWMSTLLLSHFMTGLEMINAMISLFFYSVYLRLVVFEEKLHVSKNDEVRNYFKLYKMISEISEKFKDAYKIFFLIAMLFRVPDVMSTIFYAFWYRQNNLLTDWIAFASDLLLTITFMTLTLAPAFSAGYIGTQTDRIKVLLHNKVFDEQDELKRVEIERFIRYVEARPLKFAVYKVIPLDASLLGIVFNFCITYLIVILQFSHLY